MLRTKIPMHFCAALCIVIAALCSAAHAQSNAFIKAPLCRQAKSFTCGVGAMQSVLCYYGLEVRQDILAKKLHATPHGTQFTRMIQYAQSQGFSADWKTNMSLAELQQRMDDGKPTILAIQAWADNPPVNYSNAWKDGHYVVAIGYDITNMYFMDPSTLGNFTYIPTPEFLNRWHDSNRRKPLPHFGLTISKGAPAYDPDRILRMD